MGPPLYQQHSHSSLSKQFHHATNENNNKQFHPRMKDRPVIEPPMDKQLVLLCLDYLRTLRRSRTRHDLEYELGLDQDYITLAIWALSKSFTSPSELLHGSLKNIQECLENPLAFGNDPYFQPEYSRYANVDAFAQQSTFKLSNRLSVPSLAFMESEIMYKDKSKSMKDDYSTEFGFNRALSTTGTDFNPNHTYKYEYDDEHYSNQFRFYETMGLSSKEPLTLSQIATSGITALRAQSRLQAEENMMSDQLFTNFVDAVSKNGFFNITQKEILTHPSARVGMSEDKLMEVSDKIHEERFRKVTAKFRTKLAAQHEEEDLQQLGQQGHPNARVRMAEAKMIKVSNETHEERFRRVTARFRTKLAAQDEEEDLQELGYESSQRHPENKIESSRSDDEETGFDTHSDQNSVDEKENDGDTNLHTVAYNAPDDDVTLVAASVFGDATTANESKYTADANDDESSKISTKSSRKAVVDQIDLETAERLKGYGNSAMQKKKYEKAKNYYTKALEVLPSGPTSHVYFSNRAAALLSMRNFNEAVWDAERSLSLKPDYAKAHARLGLAHFLLENYSDAVDSYTLAVQYDPSNKTSESYLEKSKKKLAALKTSQKHKENEQEEREMNENNKFESHGMVERSRNQFTGEPIKRIQSKNRYEVASFEPSENRNVRGDPPPESRMTNRQPTLSSSSRLDKYSPQRVTRNKDEEMLRKDDPPDFAITLTSDSSSKHTDDQSEADRLKGLGNKAMARKDYEEAVQFYSRSLRLAPAGPSSHVYFSNRAAALCYLQRYEEAELDAERSLALNPEYGKAHARLGLSRYFLKDYYGAVEAYESALNYDPLNGASKSYLTKARSKIGKHQMRDSYHAE